MAGNTRETKLIISAKNEASKSLKDASGDLAYLEESVKAAANALDQHKGSPRQFSDAMKNAFNPLPKIAKDAVDKMTHSLRELDAELEEVDKNIGHNKEAVKSYQRAADAIQRQVDRVELLRKAESKRGLDAKNDLKTLKVAEATNQSAAKAAADAKIVDANRVRKVHRDELTGINKLIAAEERLQKARAKKIITASVRLDNSVTKTVGLTDARRKAAAGLKPFDTQIADRNAAKAAADADTKTRAAAIIQIKQERQAILDKRKAILDTAKAEKTAYAQRKQQMLADKQNVPKGMGVMARIERDAAINRAIMKNDADYKASRGTSKAAMSALPDTKAIDERIAAQNKLIAASKATSQAQSDEIKKIQALRKPTADRIAEIDKQIAAERKLQATTNRTIQDQTGKQIASARKTADLKARKATLQPIVDKADADIKAIKDGVSAEKAAADARIATQKLLTERLRKESAERLAIIRREMRELNAKKLAETSQVRAGTKLIDTASGRRTQILNDQRQIGDLSSRAQLIQNRLTDPGSIRRIGNQLTDSPGSNTRGLNNLITETRRAGEAQRFLNGQVAEGNAGFSSMKSQIAGLVSAYAMYTVAVSQAKKVIEAFNTKEAFAVAISSTNGGDTSEATAQWEYLIASANKYKFAISGISDEYSKLVITTRGAGLTADETSTIFEGVLAKARATNLTQDRIQNAFRALNQVISKSQLYKEELQGQLAEAIPGAVNDMAKALGYSADQMKKFHKDMELGKFGSEAVVKYGQYLLDQNAGSVETAGNTFKAAVADLQNVLFETRLQLAEGGFMEGLKDTVQELTAFFKSDDGQAYMLRLSSAAVMVVKSMAGIARNLDVIITGISMIAGLKIASLLGGALTSIWAAGVAGAAGMTAMAGAAGTLAKALGALRAVAVLFGTLMGGIPGLVVAAGIAIYAMVSSMRSSDAAEFNGQMDRTKDYIDAVRKAAKDANGDLTRMRETLESSGSIDTEQMNAALKDATEARKKAMSTFNRELMQLNFVVTTDRSLSKDAKTVLKDDLKDLMANMGRMSLEDVQKRLTKIADAYPNLAEGIKKAIKGAEDFDAQNEATMTILRLLDGDLESVSESMVEGGVEAHESAAQLKEYNEAMARLKKIAGNVSAEDDFAAKMKEISTDANKAARAIAGTREEAKKLADIEKVVRGAQLTNASAFLEKRYGDAGLTLKPSAELIELVEQINGKVIAVSADGTTAGWIDAVPSTGQQYFPASSGKMVPNSKGQMVAEDPMAPGLTVSEAALLNAIAARESGKAYNVRFGGDKGTQTFDLNGQHPNIRERNSRNGTYSTAAGRYQFIGSTWRGLMGDTPFTPENQDRAALKNAEQAWASRGVKGISLSDYLDQNGMNDVVLDALKAQWEAFTRSDMRQDSVEEFNATKNRLMRDGVQTGSASQVGYAADASGTIIRGGIVAQPVIPSGELMTDVQKAALDKIAAILPSLPKDARDLIEKAVANDTSLADNQQLIVDLKSGQLDKMAAAIERYVGTQEAADFRTATAIAAQTQTDVAGIEQFEGLKATLEAMKFDEKDLKTQDSRDAAVAREIAATIEKITEGGATLAGGTGTGSDAEARALIEQNAQNRLKVAYGEKLAEEDAKRLEDQKQFLDNGEKTVRNKRQEAELAAVTDERERNILQARQQIANEQEDSGFTYSDDHVDARVAAEIDKIEAEANADIAKSKADMAKADAQSVRDAEARVELAGIENKLVRARREIELELRNQEIADGVTRTDAQRNKLIDERMRAVEAENGNAWAEEELNAKMALLQTKQGYLEDQLNAAEESGDRNRQEELRTEILKTLDAAKALNDEIIAFHKEAGGPGAEQAIANAERFGLSIDRNKDKLGEMTPEVKAIGDVIESSLNGAVSKFSQLIADGTKPWEALKQSVAQAVGQILIDIGRMITQAIIADATMKALNMSTGTTPPGGGMPGGGGGSASGIFQAIGSIFGGMGGGKFHDGGIIGDPSKSINFFKELANLKPGERPIIAEDGEEMLTRKDPRHRANMGLSIARMTRFHTGGIMGKLPDTLGAKLGASGAGGMLGKAFSSIVDGGKPALAAANPVVNVHNHFKAKDMLDQALSTPAGERAILNVIAKNKSKLGM